METDKRIPVLEPVIFMTSPKIVSKPIVIPPNIAAVGIYLLSTANTD